MIDLPYLRSALDEAINGFVDRAMEIVAEAPVGNKGTPGEVLSDLGKTILQIVSDSPEGVTGHEIDDVARAGFSSVFKELRILVSRGQLLRIDRAADQLPVYIVPKK